MRCTTKALSTVLLAGIFAFSVNARALAAEKTLKIASVVPAGTHHDNFCKQFAEGVNKRNVGVEIQVISGTPLGNAPQTMDQVVQGSVAMMGNDMAWVAPFDSDLQILNWGYTFRDSEHQKKFYESSLFADICERIRVKHGLRVLYALPAQPRLLFSVKPIKKIEDVNGLKIRVPQIKVWVEMWKTFGASPTPLSFDEVYLGLKTGTIQAAGGPASASYQYKYHQAAKYIMILGNIIPSSFIAINEKIFQSLSPEQQRAITEGTTKALQWAYKDAQSDSDATLKKMVDEGAEIVPVDKTGFMLAASKAVEKCETDGFWSKGLYAKIQAIK